MSSKAQRRGSDYRRKRKRVFMRINTLEMYRRYACCDCISASLEKLCKENYLDKENFLHGNGFASPSHPQKSYEKAGMRKINLSVVKQQTARHEKCCEEEVSASG
ncbi:hypothetical protein TNCV_1352171, partial [Trichonephila clavipes]